MSLRTDIFPINYFKSIWTPLRAFKNRHELSWWNIIFILILLNAFMTIPVTINFARVDTLPLEDVHPTIIQHIEKETIKELQQAEYSNGAMFFKEPFVIEQKNGLIAGGLSLEELDELNGNNALLFQENQYLIREKDMPDITVLYTRDFSLADMETSTEVVNELSRQWFNQNRIFVVLIFSLMISAFLLVMLVLLVFGSALFLYFTKNSPVTSITTYKESVNLLVNTLALPTIISMVYGIFTFDIIMMITLQTVGLIVMLFVIFYKIQFNDATLEEQFF